MSSLSATYIDTLIASARKYASHTLFKVPVETGEASPSGVPAKWKDITYKEYLNDVEHTSRHLTAQLRSRGIPKGSIVGLWLAGLNYDDYVYLAALCRAGYIAQLFSLSFTYPGIVLELLQKSKALALIHDPSLSSAFADAPIPIIPAQKVQDIRADVTLSHIELPENLFADENDTMLIYHTSGSTSGSPKLVPYTHKWLRATIPQQHALWAEGRPVNGPFIDPTLGSVFHAATLYHFLVLVETGGCMVFPSSLKFSSEELLAMIRECGVNMLTRYTSLASVTLKEAQSNPALLKALRNLSFFGYGGVPLSEELTDWAFENKIPLISVYGLTECGLVMSPTIDKPSRCLKILNNIAHEFEPVDVNPLSEEANAERLFELVISPGSPVLPIPALLAPNGTYRTGDLFEPAHGYPGMWVFRGRNDDFIKTETAGRCDTRAIEEKVREMCLDLVSDCVVIGNERPCPAILVESVKSGLSKEERKRIQEEVVRRTYDFNIRRLVHERVTDWRLVYVLDGEKLPRTAAKGNIRRKATEEQFKGELTAMYASIA